jgi:hypothetical protein
MNERVAEALKLVHEHLTASMIMVPLEPAIDPSTPIGEVLEYLEDKGFDLALLSTAEVRIVYRNRLRDVPLTRRDAAVRQRAESPRGDRLVEHTLELGDVARRLLEDRVPLLVIGRRGPEHVVTISDFTRPAGQAGILAVLAVLDAQLDEFLRPHDHEAWALLPTARRREVERLVDRAKRRDAEVPRLGYLNLRERFEAVRRLRLDRRYEIELGNEAQHVMITAVRNDIAHGREVDDPHAAIAALATAESYLTQLENAADPTELAHLETRSYVERLVGSELRTVTGRPNRILRVEGANLVVETRRSRGSGSRVPIDLVDSALRALRTDGTVTIDVPTLGYRSAFVGAVLLTLPGARLVSSAPPIVSLFPEDEAGGDDR